MGHEEATNDEGCNQEPKGNGGNPRDSKNRNLRPPESPATTVKITRPIMSSMTAAPRMIWLSGSCKRPRSERTRAVMPTLVAVRAAPETMATRLESERRRHAP